MHQALQRLQRRYLRTERQKAIALVAGGIVLMVVGGIGLLAPFLAVTTAQDWSRLNEQAQAAGTPVPVPAPDVAHREIADRLVIPKIGVDMPLIAGDNADTLLKGGWLFPGTARPGRAGNAVVFGHRFRYLPPVSNTFFRLDQLAVGDTFTVRWQGTDLTYRIIGSSIIEPSDFSVLAQDRTKRWMTLVTCAPAFSTRYRLAVIGELVR